MVKNLRYLLLYLVLFITSVSCTPIIDLDLIGKYFNSTPPSESGQSGSSSNLYYYLSYSSDGSRNLVERRLDDATELIVGGIQNNLAYNVLSLADSETSIYFGSSSPGYMTSFVNKAYRVSKEGIKDLVLPAPIKASVIGYLDLAYAGISAPILTELGLEETDFVYYSAADDEMIRFSNKFPLQDGISGVDKYSFNLVSEIRSGEYIIQFNYNTITETQLQFVYYIFNYKNQSIELLPLFPNKSIFQFYKSENMFIYRFQSLADGIAFYNLTTNEFKEIIIPNNAINSSNITFSKVDENLWNFLNYSDEGHIRFSQYNFTENKFYFKGEIESSLVDSWYQLSYCFDNEITNAKLNSGGEHFIFDNINSNILMFCSGGGGTGYSYFFDINMDDFSNFKQYTMPLEINYIEKIIKVGNENFAIQQNVGLRKFVKNEGDLSFSLNLEIPTVIKEKICLFYGRPSTCTVNSDITMLEVLDPENLESIIFDSFNEALFIYKILVIEVDGDIKVLSLYSYGNEFFATDSSSFFPLEEFADVFEDGRILNMISKTYEELAKKNILKKKVDFTIL